MTAYLHRLMLKFRGASRESVPEGQSMSSEEQSLAPIEKKKTIPKRTLVIIGVAFCVVLGIAALFFLPSNSVTSNSLVLDVESAMFPALSDLDASLFRAVREGDIDALCYSLSAGANPKAKDVSGTTPLRAAIALNRLAVVQELFKEADTSLLTEEDNSPLVYAIVQNRLEITRTLLEFLDEADTLNAIDKNGRTSLMYAIDRNHVEIARELVQAGADVNKADRRGYTPLMSAVLAGRADMVSALLDVGADVNLSASTGETAMSLARRRNRQVIVSILTKAGAS